MLSGTEAHLGNKQSSTRTKAQMTLNIVGEITAKTELGAINLNVVRRLIATVRAIC